MRLFLLIALLVGCSEVPTLSAPRYAGGRPIHYRIGTLQGAQGLAIYSTNTIVLDRSWLQEPTWMQDFILYHEVCHLDGYEPEDDADCCALAVLDLALLFSDKEHASLVLRIGKYDARRALLLMGCWR